MASGYNLMHPIMKAALKELGVNDNQISQTVGSATASVGFHESEGNCKDGNATHPFSSCVDLTYQLASPEFKSNMVEASFCPFVRDTGSFATNRHIHAVYVGLKDSHGKVSILPGPRAQILDYINGKNGLVGHAYLTGKYSPTQDERQQIDKQYKDWMPHHSTTVLSPEGNVIDCLAFLEQDAVRCEIPSFYDYWSIKQTITSNGYHFYNEGTELNISNAHPKIEGGTFLRGDLRAIANAIGLGITFTWTDDKSSCIVQLSYT
jgi:hypothetical protein